MNLYWKTRLTQVLSVATALSIATSASAGGPFDKHVPNVNPPKFHAPKINPPKTHVPSPPKIHAPHIHNVERPHRPNVTMSKPPKVEPPKIYPPTIPKQHTPSHSRVPVTASKAPNNLTRLPGTPHTPVIKSPSGRGLPVVNIPTASKHSQLTHVPVKLPQTMKVHLPKHPHLTTPNSPPFKVPKPIGSTLPVKDGPNHRTPSNSISKAPTPPTSNSLTSKTKHAGRLINRGRKNLLPTPPTSNLQIGTQPALPNGLPPAIGLIIAENIIQGLEMLERNNGGIQQDMPAQLFSNNGAERFAESFAEETPIASYPVGHPFPADEPLQFEMADEAPVLEQYTYVFVNTTDARVSYSIHGQNTAWGTYHLEPGKHHEYTVKHATMEVRLDVNQEAAFEVPGEAAYAFIASESGLQLATVEDEQGIDEQ